MEQPTIELKVSESQDKRRAERRSLPPSGADPPPTDAPVHRASTEGRLSDSTSLRIEDAKAFRDELECLLERYSDKEHGRAYTDGVMTGCALCVNPRQVLEGLLDSLDTALKQSAHRSGGGHHE
jgi:hypothetical protein